MDNLTLIFLDNFRWDFKLLFLHILIKHFSKEKNIFYIYLVRNGWELENCLRNDVFALSSNKIWNIEFLNFNW